MPRTPARSNRGGVCLQLLAAALLALAPPAFAQDEPIFGVELELRGREVTAVRTSELSGEGHRRILAPVVAAIGGDPNKIKLVEYSVPGPDGQPRRLVRAEYTDARGGLWKVVPEWVSGGGRQQVDYELVTPKLSDPAKVEAIVRALKKGGFAREGLQSSTHIHIDGRSLIKGGNATGLVNLINLHEGYEPLLRRLFAPSRGAGIYNPLSPTTGAEGAWVNRFSRPLYLDHPELLAKLAALPPSARTKKTLEALFKARDAAEAKVHGLDGLGSKGWKYRSLNVANLLDVNPNLPATKGSVEFRMNDLHLEDPATHRLQVELYRALVKRARALAAAGKVVGAPKHRAVPAGENPAAFLTSADPAQAKAMIRGMLKDLGLDPARYEPLMTRNVKAPRVWSKEKFRERVAELPIDRAVGLSRSGTVVSIRVPVAAGEMARASATARAMAARANAALHLNRVAHAGAKKPTSPEERVTVETTAKDIVIRLETRQLNRATAQDLLRLLASGVTQTGFKGGGLPRNARTLVEHAQAYAKSAEGRTLSARTVRALEVLATRGGNQLLLPLLEWGQAPYLPKPVARDLRFRAERYLAELIRTADAISPRTGGIEPAVVRSRELVRTWAKQTRLGDVLFRSLLARRTTASPPRATDRLARYRRSDGTLKWKQMLKENALREGAGLAKFGLALFLKEVAVVASTGDRVRIEEFFDGLMSTDFYKHYGLFVAGARLAEVGYTRYLQRYIKPRFVNGLLKTNMVLAAGMALPMIVEGNFEGKAFAISLASLGISSAAVSAGVRGIKWVMDLKQAKRAGTLARIGVGASRFAKVGGWFYQVAELAVVLYFAEKIETKVNAWLDLKQARADLAKAGQDFVTALNAPGADAAAVGAASDAYHEAWVKYRNFLYGPLHVDEALLASRMARLAKKAKLKADERKSAIATLNKHASLRRNIERRYGSVEKYAEALVRAGEQELEAEANKYVDAYNKSREKHLEEVYEANKRGTPLLANVDHLDWLLAGGRRGAAGDPYGRRGDLFATWGRDRARASLSDALAGASRNRLEAYDDERAILNRLIGNLKRDGKGELAKVLERKRDLVGLLRVADANLIKGNGLIDTRARGGAAERIRRVTGD